MGYRWKPSKTKAREFAIKMQEIKEFCKANNIDYSRSMDSYYFSINGEKYRVSNHTQAQSDRGMYSRDEFGSILEQQRDSYHRNPDGSYEFDRAHEITASKTRIIEIYTALKEGKTVDKRGRVLS